MTPKTRLQRWGAVMREVAQLDSIIAECTATIAQIDTWLAMNLASATAGVGDYSGMPRNGSTDTVVERRVLECEELRNNLLMTRLTVGHNLGGCINKRARLLAQVQDEQACVYGLSVEDKHIVWQRYVEGETLDKIAEDTHLGKTSVHRRLEYVWNKIGTKSEQNLA